MHMVSAQNIAVGCMDLLATLFLKGDCDCILHGSVDVRTVL